MRARLRTSARYGAPAFAERAEEALRAGGGRMTPTRRALLSVLAALEGPATPSAIQAALRRRGTAIDRVSVYRNLGALLAAGVLHRVAGSTAVRPCADGAPRGSCHHALLCSQCGRAQEFHSASMERALTEVRRSTGFEVQDHVIELRGLCASCQAPRAGRRRP